MPEDRTGVSSAELPEIYEILESERSRMALELERLVVEPLNLLVAQAGLYEQSMASNPMARLVSSVLATMGRQVLNQSRELIESLRPVVLFDLGLEAGLEWLAGQLTRTRGMQVNCSLQRLPERLPLSSELNFFRAIQLILEEAAELSCHSATLRAFISPDGLLLQINLKPSMPEFGKGLVEAETRLEMLGGSREIKPEIAQIDLRIPINRPVVLTRRELEVLEGLAEGRSNKEIAAQLQLSPRTVNFHLDNIYAKLSVTSRTGAVVEAVKRGWLKKPR
jgi:DNA-binding CsgD family transcriptional regulator